MKNSIIITVLVFTSAFAKVNAQTAQLLDTIYANDTKNVALFFHEPIRQGISGSENFIFTYNRDKEQYFGLLQAKPGKESNLLVVSRDGSIFSFILKYRKALSKLNYFIPISSRIGNEKPLVKDIKNESRIEDSIDPDTYYYNKFSSYLLRKEQRIGSLQKRRERIILSVENIVFDKDELYFVIRIENKSSLDYDVNFLNLYLETRRKGKKKSLQSLQQEPIFKYKLPSRIGEDDVARFVYVMPKFSIDKDRRLVLELNEKRGERNIELKLSHHYINHPN